ncbi:MAG: ParB/RepB/Spo0J family partition protein [Candidatus Omnitrophota bacterium]
MEKRALGRGLEALIQPKEIDAASQPQERILQIATSEIQTNKYQPRLGFDQEKLGDLMNSIKEKGVVQPVLVRKTPAGYELIAGERRLRAAKNLGMEKIPAIVKNVADIDMLEISLIENIQREELNPMEEAFAFQKFITDFDYTQERIATALGKDRSTIANTIRLLGLPKKVQEYISKNAITAGHARAILSLPTETARLRLADTIIKRGLSVREAEKAVARRALKTTDPVKTRDQSILEIENKLQQLLGTRVRIFHGSKRGRIQVEYYSNEDLNRILDIVLAKRES